MVKLELSECHNFDDIMSEFKITPSDLEIPIPKYYVIDNESTIRDRHSFITNVRNRIDSSQPKEEEHMSIAEAVLIIQRHERARQGRLRAKILQENRQKMEAEDNSDLKVKSSLTSEGAAIIIQKHWRGYLARQYTKSLRQEEFIWLGMEPRDLHYNSVTQNTTRIAQKIERQRRVLQYIYKNEYDQALVKLKEQIRLTEGTNMQDRMKEQLRQWFLQCREANDVFPNIPPQAEGGSQWLFKRKPIELIAKEEAKRIPKKSAKTAKATQAIKKEKKPEGWVMPPSQFTQDLNDGLEEYNDKWKNRDESDNFFQRHNGDIIKFEKRSEVENEIRANIDELMRQELRNLKIAIDKEKLKRINKKAKIAKPKKKKGAMKDLTKNRNFGSICEELVIMNIMKKPKTTNLSEYYDVYSYSGDEKTEIQPSLSDVKQLVTLYGILPLGSPDVHAKVPLTRSIMLTGPEGTGKKMLVNAICTETGANLFDLSPVNVAGKYEGKQAIRLLVNMVFKVANLLQPSVIMIDQCQRMFGTKVPKSERVNLQALKKNLVKAMKTVKQGNRILLVGTTKAPFDAKVKPLCKLYDRIILIPRPDYGTRYLLWKTLIVKNGGKLTRGLDISSLAKVSDGYTAGIMERSCKEILTERRLALMDKIPLQGSELIAPLARNDPVFVNEEEAYKKWYRKTPLGKKKAKMMKEEDEAKRKEEKLINKKK
nr:IQ and AAA domain containing protein 1 [Hymenolepis microstoma]